MTKNGRYIFKNKDAVKEHILDVMRKEALRGNYWHTINSLSKITGHAHITVRQAIVSMSSEGFIELRDGDTRIIDYHIALKKSLRDEIK